MRTLALTINLLLTASALALPTPMVRPLGVRHEGSR